MTKVNILFDIYNGALEMDSKKSVLRCMRFKTIYTSGFMYHYLETNALHNKWRNCDMREVNFVETTAMYKQGISSWCKVTEIVCQQTVSLEL